MLISTKFIKMLSNNNNRNGLTKLLKNHCNQQPQLTERQYTNGKNICKRLNGKVAIVTASTDGIGFAIAERLANEGAQVIISSRKLENVNRAIKTLHENGLKNTYGMKCHVSNADDRKHLFDVTREKYGRLDILISNAAVNPAVGPILDCPEDVWDKIFDVNVKSSFLLAKEALPYLKQSAADQSNNHGGGGGGGGGSSSIIFVSSIAGYQPIDPIGAYSVSKTALLGLTKAISQDVSKFNIRVNCVAPGIIRTKFAQALHETEESKNAMFKSITMKRLGEPHEIAGVVAFLASDDSSYITGETIAATGGWYSRL